MMSKNCKELYDMLKPDQDTNDFNVDVVFVNVINGNSIA